MQIHWSCRNTHSESVLWHGVADYMEYLLIKMPKNLLELQAIVALLLSEKIDEKYMYFGQSTQMNILSEEIEWTLDGENGGMHKEVNIKVCSQALRLIVGMSEIN